MSLNVTVLGSSGTYAGVDGACTGFLVRSTGATVMMDAGPGTLANLQRHVRADQLDAVVLSHCHPDHWLELPVLRNALKYVLSCHGVQLFCTVETLDMAEHLTGGKLADTFVPHVITDGSEVTIGDQHWRCSLTDHPVETLGLRVERHCANARRVADALAAHPAIGRVLYPGRPDHPQHALAAKQMSDFGGVVTFDVKAGKQVVFAALNRLQIVDISNNLGDAKSLVTHPATTTHMRIGAEERAKLGITDGTIRISVGLEDVEDIVADLVQALDG